MALLWQGSVLAQSCANNLKRELSQSSLTDVFLVLARNKMNPMKESMMLPTCRAPFRSDLLWRVTDIPSSNTDSEEESKPCTPSASLSMMRTHTSPALVVGDVTPENLSTVSSQSSNASSRRRSSSRLFVGAFNATDELTTDSIWLDNEEDAITEGKQENMNNKDLGAKSSFDQENEPLSIDTDLLAQHNTTIQSNLDEGPRRRYTNPIRDGLNSIVHENVLENDSDASSDADPEFNHSIHFYKLIREHELQNTQDTQSTRNIANHISSLNEIKEMPTPKFQVTVGSFPRIFPTWVLTKRSFFRLTRNWKRLLFFMFLPVMQVLLVSLAVGPIPHGIQYALVNLDQGVSMLDHSLPLHHDKSNNSDIGNAESRENLGSRIVEVLESFQTADQYQSTLVQRISQKFHPVIYESEDKALKDIASGYLWASIVIPSDYSLCLLKRSTAEDGENEQNDQTLMSSCRLGISMDMSNQQVALQIRYQIQAAFRIMYMQFLDRYGLSPNLADPIIDLQGPQGELSSPDFSDFIIPGVIAIIVFSSAMVSPALFLLSDKSKGILQRFWAGAIRPSEVIISLVFAHVLFTLVQSGLVLSVAIFSFNENLDHEEMGRGFLVLAIICWLGISVGLVLGSMAANVASGMRLIVGLILPLLLMSGVLWPLEAVSWKFLRSLWYALPTTWACASLRAVLVKEDNVGHPYLITGVFTTLMWSIFLTISSLYLLGSQRSLAVVARSNSTITSRNTK